MNYHSRKTKELDVRAKLISLVGALCLLLSACTAPTSNSDNGYVDRFGNDSNTWQGPSPDEVEEDPDETEDEDLPTGEDNLIILPPGDDKDPSSPPREIPEPPRPSTTFQNTAAEREFVNYLDHMRQDYNVRELRRRDDIDEIAVEHAKWSVNNNVLLAPESPVDSYRRGNRVTKYGESLVATGGPNVALTAYNIFLHDATSRRFLIDPDVTHFGVGTWCINGSSCVFALIALTTNQSVQEFDDDGEPEENVNILEGWDGVIDKQYKSCEEVLAHNLGPYVEGIDPEYFWYEDVNSDGITCDSLDVTGGSSTSGDTDEGEANQSSDDSAESTASPEPGDSASATEEPQSDEG